MCVKCNVHYKGHSQEFLEAPEGQRLVPLQLLSHTLSEGQYTHVSINKLSFPFIFLFNCVNIRCTAPGGPGTPGCP